jgi:hypothetical protein
MAHANEIASLMTQKKDKIIKKSDKEEKNNEKQKERDDVLTSGARRQDNFTSTNAA